MPAHRVRALLRAPLILLSIAIAVGLLPAVSIATPIIPTLERIVGDEALVEFTLPNRAAIDDMLAQDADLAEYVRENPDGTVTVNAFVTAEQRLAYELQGWRSGAIIEDRSTWEARLEERAAAIADEERAHEAAENGGLGLIEIPPLLQGAAAAEELETSTEVTVMRADFFSNYAGTFLSVEARTALGTNSGGPTMAVAWREDAGLYGSAATMSKFTDSGQYMYHRVLIRIGPAGATTPVPAVVRVASSTGEAAEKLVETWVGGGLPPYADGYLTGFFTHYMDAVEVHDRINVLAAEFPNIAEIIDLPYQTEGYQRKSMAVMAGTTGIGSTPSNTSQAVLLIAKAYGQDGGNQVQAQFVNPGVPSSPLAVTVAGNVITVQLRTDAGGALASTAAQVVSAINASAEASALVTAHTYAGSTGTGVVQARALASLSDFLNAPATVPRGRFQVQAIRIGKHRDGSKVGVYLYCQQHAREWVTPLVCIETAERLLRNYAIDPATKDMVDELDIFIVPSFNPDGALYSFYDASQQRRSMTRHCSLSTSSGMPPSRNSWGVDNNRNNTVGTFFDGYAGASSSCTSDTYAGPSELSEPENRNDAWLIETFGNIKFSNNIHSYGGYFMWAPGAYRSAGRVTLPAPNIGIEAYFFEGADLILNRIKEYRGTAILPSRTGPVADVLYSAAGNSADEHWYRKGIIAYSFETGADRFSSTSTGTSQSAVGFQPNFANEGSHEGMEFASGNYGLLETALAYARDDEPPVANIVPPGGLSRDPIEATFEWEGEPAVIHYTTDGSAPTLSSPTWEARGPRQPGETLRFTETTTVQWLAVDIKGNTSDVRSARFVVDAVAPVTTATFDPPARNGWLRDPAVTLTAEDDGGADVDTTEYRLDGGQWTPYAGPFSVTGDGDHTIGYRSTDTAGNVEDERTVELRIDATAPDVEISSPLVGARYEMHEQVFAGYACDDALSGLESCEGPVEDGAPLDTSTPGTHAFTVRAVDMAGNATERTVYYAVEWPFEGFFAPVQNPPAWNERKAGSAIPLMFNLGGDRGLDIFADGYPVSRPVLCGTGTPLPGSEPTQTPGGSTLTYDEGVYHYNWMTSKGWSATCRELILRLADGSEHTALVAFR